MERRIEVLLYLSRWLLAPIYLALPALLVLVGVTFARELWALGVEVWTRAEHDMILATLTLIDLALVASLLVMVALSGYENFVSRLDDVSKGDRLPWVGKLDVGSLKLNLASTIVAISSIHLLKAFMEVEQIANDKLMWLVLIHLTFVATTVAMGLVERMRAWSEGSRREREAPFLSDRIIGIPAGEPSERLAAQ